MKLQRPAGAYIYRQFFFNAKTREVSLQFIHMI